MRKFLLLSLFLFSIQFSFAQNLKDTVKVLCEKMVKATISGDYPTLIDYTYPKIVEMMGGKESAIALISQQMEAMKKDNSGIESFTLGEPSEIIELEEGELQCIIPQTMIMKITGEKYRVAGGTIGVSNDKGKNWTFLNIERNDVNFIRQFLPTFSDKLKLPEKKFEKVNN